MFFKPFFLCDSTTGLALITQDCVALPETAEFQYPMQTANEVLLHIFNNWYTLMH